MSTPPGLVASQDLTSDCATPGVSSRFLAVPTACDLAAFEAREVEVATRGVLVEAAGEEAWWDFPEADATAGGACVFCAVTAGKVGAACEPAPLFRSALVTARITAATITATS